MRTSSVAGVSASRRAGAPGSASSRHAITRAGGWPWAASAAWNIVMRRFAGLPMTIIAALVVGDDPRAAERSDGVDAGLREVVRRDVEPVEVREPARVRGGH